MNTEAGLWKLLWKKIMVTAVYSLGAVLVIYFFIVIAWFVTTLGFSLNILK